MSSARLYRGALGLLVFAAAALVFLLLSTVRIAGAAPVPPGEPQPKKENQPKAPLDVKGQLDENDPNDPVQNQPCKTYNVKLKKGKTYVIDMRSKDFDSYLRLENSKGLQVAEDDDSGGNFNAQIVVTPEMDDTFKLFATRFDAGTGNFTLKVRELGYKPGKVQTLNKGTLKVQSKLTNEDPEDPLGRRHRYKIYTLKLVAGRSYTIDLVSSDFDAFLRLTDSSFSKLAEDDDGGGDLNSRIVFMPKTDGVYHIVATSLDGQIGDFTLTVNEEK